MAYVTPDSTIKLMKGVPLDINQADTCYFDNVSAQETYFNTFVYATLTAQSYNRQNRGKFRAAIEADLIIDVNYLAYKNTHYSNKWFYAFVTQVDYINDGMSEITFVIDEIQTWFFDYTVPPCLVERMHADDDTIGANTVAEKIAPGEYVVSDKYNFEITDDNQSIDFSKLGMLVMFAGTYSYDSNNPTVSPYASVNDGIIGAGRLIYFERSVAGLLALAGFMLEINSQMAGVMGAYMVPDDILNNPVSKEPLTLTESGKTLYYNFQAINDTYKLDGYPADTQQGLTNKVKNKKLLTYPYNFLSVTNYCGQRMNCCYEYFQDNHPKFIVETNVTYPVSLTLRPRFYKCGKTYNEGSPVKPEYNTNMLECIEYTDFPQCSIAVDTFAAWIAQKAVPFLQYGNLSLLASAGGAAVSGALSGNPVSAGIGAGQQILNSAIDLMDSAYQASIAAPIIQGSALNGSNNCSNKHIGFTAYRMTVDAEKAREIDDYFSAFGYAQNRIMQTTRKIRTAYTYIKTIGAIVEGSLPADSAKKIAQLYDNGIRFWADTAHFGNLNIDNPIPIE